MEFYTPSKEKRPVRLSERTRDFAMRSFKGFYGDDAIKNWGVVLENTDNLSYVDKYDFAISEIAKKAPIRITDEELVCGSATLGGAIYHRIPAVINGDIPLESISHLTLSFEPVLTKGLNFHKQRIEEKLKDTTLTERQVRFLHSLKNVITSFEIWHKRYLDETKDKKPEVFSLLKQVPFFPARNFKEAVQSLWITFAFTRLCGNWSGIGRIDAFLGDYLSRDLANGDITLETARQFLASFFIKGCEWIQSDSPIGSGDAQHYQNIVLSGIDENGEDITNEVTYLVLDIVEELGISDFPITVRVNSKTDEKLLKKVAAVMRHGGGVVAIYNEDLILSSLESVGYDSILARNFANDGCWEVQIPGQTDFAYIPIDSLQVLSRALGIDGSRPFPECESIDEIYALYKKEMQKSIDEVYKTRVLDKYTETENGFVATEEQDPASVVSLFEEGCIERALSYHEFGPNFTVRSPHIGGAADTGNSLFAIEKIVFEDKKITLEQLLSAVKNNWEDNEALRLYIKNKLTYFGNDNDKSDAFTVKVLDDFAKQVHSKRKANCPILFIPGVSTFGRQIEWLPFRCATAFGAKKGEILSGNASPTPGTDSSGATAIIKSYCKANHHLQTNGSALDVKLFSDTVKGEEGIDALVALIRGFVALGGYFMQLDVLDAQILKEAQKNPQNYKTLSVRVSGWNARFITLDEKWQKMIIERTQSDV